MGKTLGFGVVGLGMGKHHCRAVRAAKGAHLAAICDVRRELADQVATQTGQTKKQAMTMVDAVFDSITRALRGGAKATIVGFGTLRHRRWLST